LAVNLLAASWSSWCVAAVMNDCLELSLGGVANNFVLAWAGGICNDEAGGRSINS
jgi:hypothetical protein